MKIRDRIIRRLGGTPVRLFGRDPLPGWELVPVESRIEQDVSGIAVTVKYEARKPEKGRRKKK